MGSASTQVISAGVTLKPTPRAVVLAASVMLRHVTDDPVRAVTLAWRALPSPLRGLVVLAGPYGRAAAPWGAGGRRGALPVLEGSAARRARVSRTTPRRARGSPQGWPTVRGGWPTRSRSSTGPAAGAPPVSA